MADDKITIEVDGEKVEARPGQMLIEVTDRAGCYVPRFCYHEKLSIAANCRMCLVEVEKAPKPLPACATPVAPDMKVFTRSPAAIGAQRATMEFLLINHPLDCPICDQGGECELQDLAMGFGRDVSRFAERKRVVRDKNIGPLVSTDMTRCIHCTRCVRFGEEIQGMPELGTTGRGDRMEITTYVERSLEHELSGNVIDLCPVGALNSKPYRFSARAWEMEAHDTISPHDCVGSNLQAHVLRGRVKRVVPRANDSINETWISDRDRFSYEGIYANDRLTEPMVRKDGVLTPVSWQDALDAAVGGLKEVISEHEPEALATWISPSATLEEHFLAARIMDHIGSGSIDSRLGRRDFRDQDRDAVTPGLGIGIEELAAADAVFVVGSAIRHEAPILAHRLRQAAIGGAKVAFLDSESRPYYFERYAEIAEPAQNWCAELAAIVTVADGRSRAEGPLAEFIAGADEPKDAHRSIANMLDGASNGVVLVGLAATAHPDYAALSGLADAVAKATGCRLSYVTEGANSAGAAIAGALPNRGPGGHAKRVPGRHLADMIDSPPPGLILFGVEPESDIADGAAASGAVERADFVVSMTSYLSGTIETHADVVLPIATFAETSGTFVNVAGNWQSFQGVAEPVGQARPGWKVLRVLANLLGLPDSEYQSTTEVCDDLKRRLALAGAPETEAGLHSVAPIAPQDADWPTLSVGIYQTDAVVRRADSLQQTNLAGTKSSAENRAIA